MMEREIHRRFKISPKYFKTGEILFYVHIYMHKKKRNFKANFIFWQLYSSIGC